MPATHFLCPDKTCIPIQDCLTHCHQDQRCLFLPTLRAVSTSLLRNIDGFSITELLNGTREMYLKKSSDYAVDPFQRLYAIQGSAAHLIHSDHAHGNMLSEERLYGEHCSGAFDLYGAILDDDTATLGDIKVTSSYKLMRALGKYKVDVPAEGEFYKSGPRKGQEKTVKEWRDGGVRHVFEWATQINYYRMLLQAEGLPVKKMVIQAFCRDQGLQVANSRGIEHQAYFIEIHRISDVWLQRYVQAKAKRLQYALANKELPPVCSARERWHDRKCLGYCDVKEHCSYAQNLKSIADEAA